jgi:cold shock protein
MAAGTLWWINYRTGYGFIRPDDGGRDVLVRGTDLALGGSEPLDVGAEVSYEVHPGGTGMSATNVYRRRRYSWRDDCLQRHKGKEARNEYYAGLEGRAPLG